VSRLITLLLPVALVAVMFTVAVAVQVVSVHPL
jgi:hypothetical protein